MPDGCPMGLKEQRISFQSLRKVYGSTDSEKCSGKKTAREIAEMLKSPGVSQKSISLVWHVNRFDLTILRELLKSKGYTDIVPPQGNCIPMIKHYRAGLPPRDQTGRIFTSSLDQLFPLLFPGYQLVRMNHNAAPDIEMLLWMVLLLVQLQNPPARRELKEFPIATQESVRSAKTRYNSQEKWLAIPDLEIPDNIWGKDDGDGEEDEEDGAEGDSKRSLSMVQPKELMSYRATKAGRARQNGKH